MKKKVILIVLGFFFIIFIFLVSATNISSPDYSGYFTQGTSPGSIADSNYAGDSASFYQQAIGFLNDTFYMGIHGFSFQIANPLGFVPAISIIKPTNGTYVTGTNIPFNFTAVNANSVWYNLDNGANTTLNGNIIFNTTTGQHTLYLYANNSNGNSTAKVIFTVNSSKFFVDYDNYSTSVKGASTNFNQSTYEELQNLSNVILENTNYGKIIFNQAINITADANLSDNAVSLDNYTLISSNNISINSTALPNFNQPATLYLYNLNFSNPQILKDGSICPASICTKISYTVTTSGNGTYYNGTLVFNATGFSAYSTQENVTAPSGGGTITIINSGGNGGGGTAGPSSLFTVDPSQISVSLIQGEVVTQNVTITNTGSQAETIQIGNTIPDFVVRSDDLINLNAGESKTVELYVLARINTPPDLYLGKITVSSGNVEKDVLIAINVESKGSLFDVAAEIPTQYLTVSPGNDLLANIKIYNLGAQGTTADAAVQYVVKDENGNVITNLSDTVAVQTQTSYTKTINIPSSTPLGKYALYVGVTYNGKVASSSVFFTVASSVVSQQEKVYIIIIIILSIVLAAVIYYAITRRERHSKKGGIKRGGKQVEEKIDLIDLLKK